MKRVEVFLNQDFSQQFSPQNCQQALNALESGQVLLFPHLSFQLSEDEKQFLTPNAVSPKEKNISFDAKRDILLGDNYSGTQHELLKSMVKRYAAYSCQLVTNLLPAYLPYLQQARTSYRPMQVATRNNLSPRKDDRRLHVDAFPSSPNQGKRILRIFSNINPAGESRVWRVGDSFENVAKLFLPKLRQPLPFTKHLLKKLRITKSLRTPYDSLMLQLHDLMKSNENYQREVPQEEVHLPAGSTWIVFTDQVSHAAMSGQFCLEQTFYLPVAGMVMPERSPLHVLQSLTGRQLSSGKG